MVSLAMSSHEEDDRVIDRPESGFSEWIEIGPLASLKFEMTDQFLKRQLFLAVDSLCL
jgi:hypothetical protein